MKLTHSLIHSAGRSGVGFNYHQLKVLGIHWPPKKGWLSSLIGKDISDEQWKLIVAMKGKGRNERRRILDGTDLYQNVFSVPKKRTSQF